MRLFLQHEDALRAFIRSLVPTQESAREIMQDVAVVLWRKFDGVEDNEDFRRWAFGVARLEALEYRRTRARDRHVFGDEVISLLAASAEASAEVFEAERRALGECLQKLPEPQRVLVETAYAPRVRIDELAARSGRTAMSLYKALHRIRLALMECTEKVLAREAAT
ncbi:MAG: sigma-70 family RNA polymerase sigma factor [Gemmataceae bacterium]